MAITKKIRFEVFKRDGFTCQYCGNTPPNVTLEVDHIIPKSKSGKDDINNLATSCFDCNRGKSNIELKTIPNTIQTNIQILEEKEAQYNEYCKLLKKIQRRIKREIHSVSEEYTSFFPEYELKEKFCNSSIKQFIDKLGTIEVIDSMNKACQIIDDPDDSIKYFCGICWNKINSR